MYRLYTSDDFNLKTAFTDSSYYKGGATYIFKAFWCDPDGNGYELVYRNDSSRLHLIFYKYCLYCHCIEYRYWSYPMREGTIVIPCRQAYFVYAYDMLPEDLRNSLIIATLEKYGVLDLVLSKVR